MSFETELKFRIPAARLAAVRRAVATRTAVVEPLAAVYLDTPGEHLAQARVALRLRREGVQWVQTLKAEGAGAMQRLEHNVPLGQPGGAGNGGDGADSPAGAKRPTHDLARHAGTEAGALLGRVLAGAGNAPLVERYATEVRRTRRTLRHGGALIELALDEGRIRAGTASCAVCEIEFELLSGPPQALLAVASRWVDRFGLVLDVRSKSERGHRLATGQASSAPTRARPLTLSARSGLDSVLAAMLGNALGQVLANASVLATPDDAPAAAAAAAAAAAEVAAAPAHHPLPDTELLHQLRVGLRRLRTVLTLFAGLLPPAVTGLSPALATVFAQLGAARDRDAMAEWLWPALQAAGAPAMPLSADPDTGGPQALSALLTSPAVQQLWLALLGATLPGGLVQPDPALGGEPAARTAPPVRQVLREPLQRLLRQVRRDAARFNQLDTTARHRLRRRIKRLRYAVELSASLWPAKRCARFLRALQRAQTPLGAFNDSVVAQDYCQALVARDPQAWFAVGWLAAHRQSLEPPCTQALARLSKAGGFG